jgi:hypothetical protein
VDPNQYEKVFPLSLSLKPYFLTWLPYSQSPIIRSASPATWLGLMTIMYLGNYQCCLLFKVYDVFSTKYIKSPRLLH